MILSLMVIILLCQTTDLDIPNAIASSFNYSLRLLQKGFDFTYSISFISGMEIQFYTIYNSIVYLLVRMPLECILIGTCLAYFQLVKEQK